MNLIFDTETTGFPKKDLPLFHDDQPHIAQVAGMLCDDEGVVHSKFSLLIEPRGWEMPAQAEAVHGLSTNHLLEKGIPIMSALSVLANLGKKVKRIIGHNLQYDLKLFQIEMARIQKTIPVEFDMCGFCTMQTMTPICKLPGPRGPKWPKLIEAYNFCFGKDFEDAHDALGDVIATKEIFFWLKANGHVK